MLLGLVALALVGAFLVFTIVRRDGDSVPAVSDKPYTYVALGDSYSAGEGLAPYNEGTDTPPNGDDCHRSQTQSYVELLANAVKATTLNFLACSGAQTANIFQSEQHSGEGVQAASSVLDPTTSLVTITIGGNDVEFANVVGFCAKTANCNTAVYTPNDQPGHGTSAPLDSWAAARLDALHPQLHDVFVEIHKRAPQAKVIVVGYPHLFGDAASPSPACQLLYGLVDSNERTSLNALADDLNKTIQSAAVETGAQFVDIAPYFSGHEPCAPQSEWINTVLLQGGSPQRGAFHPNAIGQQMYARIIHCAITVATPAMTKCVNVSN